MKKLFLVCVLLIGGSIAYTLPVCATETSYAANSDLPGDAQPITVYKVVQVGGSAWSTSPVSAYYSSSENCIYVSEGRRKNQPYTINENRAYGQPNDGRAEYRYVAGGYYFNL